MQGSQLLRIISVLLALVAVSAEPKTTLTPEATEVRPGDSISFNCTVQGLVGGQSFLRVRKFFMDKTIDIATNNNLLPAFSAPRYNIELLYDPNAPADILKFKFTITDARPVDSGEYDCAILGSNSLLADSRKQITVLNTDNFAMELTVERPLTGEMQRYTPGSEGHVFSLDEDEEFYIKLDTTAIDPPPTIKFMVGQKDVTLLFNVEMIEEVFPSTDSALAATLEGKHTRVKAEGNPYIDYSFTKGFRAVATVGNRTEEVGFKVEFSGFPPIVNENCKKSILAGSYQNNIVFNCSVMSNEPVDVYFEYVNELASGKKESKKLSPGETNNHFKVDMLEETDDGNYIAVLRIPHVTPNLFRQYSMVAINTKGNTTHTFQLERDPQLDLEAPTMPPTNSCLGLDIRVDISKQVVDLGDSVRIQCHVQNENQEVRVFINWVKKVGEEETTMGTNTKIDTPFSDTGRYSSTVIYNKEQGDLSDVTFILDIKDVEATDSGEIGCRLSIDEIELFEDLIVKVPFDSLAISSRNSDGTHHVTYEDGETVIYDEGELRSFTCKATGGYPKPEMTLTLGGKDITSDYELVNEMKQVGVHKGLSALGYDISLSNEEVETTYAFNNKTLECTARIPDTEFSETTSIHIELSGYKPQFICADKMLVPLHKEDINITCHVYADPPLNANDTMYYWDRASVGNDSIAGPTGHIGQFAAFMENGTRPNEWVMILNIDHIFINHFRTYYFEAGNELGKVVYGVTLERDPNYQTITAEPGHGQGHYQVPGTKDVRSAATCAQVVPGLLLMLLGMAALA